jgi:hypothetical protein
MGQPDVASQPSGTAPGSGATVTNGFLVCWVQTIASSFPRAARQVKRTVYVPRWGRDVGTPAVAGARVWRTRKGAEGWVAKNSDRGYAFTVIAVEDAEGAQ